MKPIPDINDEAAMLLRGKRSALASARNEATAELRDAYTLMEACEWGELNERLARVRSSVERLGVISVLWSGLK